MKILLLNGPPGCGKDTAGNILSRKYGFHTEKFAAPIRKVMCALFDLTDEEIERYKSLVVRGGHTIREWMIGFSEDYAKKYGGEHIFGELLATRLHLIPDAVPVVVTDLGFTEEGEVLVSRFGAENILLIHLERDGYSFEGDSRSYVRFPDVQTIRIYNNGSVHDFEQVIIDALLIDSYVDFLSKKRAAN